MEMRDKRGVCSQLNSREIFEHIHRPSMDDTNVWKASRNQSATNPGDIEIVNNSWMKITMTMSSLLFVVMFVVA